MDIQQALTKAVMLLNKCSITMKDAPLAAQAYDLIDYAGMLAAKIQTAKKEDANEP